MHYVTILDRPVNRVRLKHIILCLQLIISNSNGQVLINKMQMNNSL